MSIIKNGIEKNAEIVIKSSDPITTQKEIEHVMLYYRAIKNKSIPDNIWKGIKKRCLPGLITTGKLQEINNNIEIKIKNINELERLEKENAKAKKEAKTTEISKNGKMKISVSKDDYSLTEHTHLCFKALTEIYNNPFRRIFVRGGKISQVGVDENNNFTIKQMKEEDIRNSLDKCVDFFRLSQKEEEVIEVKARCPIDVCENMIVEPEITNILPVILGITESPYITETGEIITKPGYNSKTKLYFAVNDGYKEIELPDKPSRDDAIYAYDRVMGLFKDFQFEDQASRQNVFAALLTTIIRPAIKGCVPMHLVDKPQMGVGGSLVDEIIVRIATGKGMSPSNAPKDANNEEWEKSINGMLQSGRTIVCYDNIESNFYNAALASIITSERKSCRLLGSINDTIFENHIAWLGNGINLTIGGDMPRRVFHSRLSTNTSRPQQRTGFTIPNIKQHVLEHRYEYLRDILIIAKAYIISGRPAPIWKDVMGKECKLPEFGGFEEWRNMIGGMMIFLKKYDFLGNLESLLTECESQTSDEDLLLEAISVVFKDKKFLSKDVIAIQDKTIIENLPRFITTEESDNKKSKRLTWFFKKINGRVFSSGYKIQLVDDSYTGEKSHHGEMFRVVFIHQAGNEEESKLNKFDTRKP
jgi:hypothetical protein